MSLLLDQLPEGFALGSEQLRSYLASDGWRLVRDFPETGTELWQVRTSERLNEQVILPNDPTFLDFKVRLSDAVQRICDVYGWDLGTLVRLIQNNRTDLFVMRAEQDTYMDSIPLKQAEQLIHGATKLLEAAAWATYSPRAVLSGRKPNSVKDYVADDLRMGHTQRGSFIITILSRIDDAAVQIAPEREVAGFSGPDVLTDYIEPDDEVGPPAAAEQYASPTDPSLMTEGGEEAQRYIADSAGPPNASERFLVAPFQRRVLTTLAAATFAAEALAKSNILSAPAIERAVNQGVSAQLCQSLVSMTRFEGLRQLDLSFNWATLPRIVAPELAKVEFNRDAIAGLERLPDRFKAEKSVDGPQTITITGRVTRLEQAERRDPNIPDGYIESEVATVAGVIGRREQRAVRVDLEERIRDAFIRAYDRRQTVAVSGVIARDTKGYKLTGDVTIDDR